MTSTQEFKFDQNRSLNEIILDQTILSIKSGSVFRNQSEALVTYDFVKENQRSSLMRFCFSNLSTVVLFLVLLLIYLNPFRYHLQLTQYLGLENLISQWLFGSNVYFIFTFSVFLFCINYFFKFEFWLLALIGYFLSNGDIHLVLTLIFLPMILMTKGFYFLKQSKKLKGEVRKITKIYGVLNLISIVLSTTVVFNFYLFLRFQGVFAQNMSYFRLEFYILSLIFYYGLEFLLLSIWGHLKFKSESETSQVRILFSTAVIMNNLSLSSRFKIQIKNHISNLLQSRQKYTQSDLDLLPKRLVDHHQIEESFLLKAKREL